MKESQVFEFIRFCVNDKVALPRDMERMDWAGLFRFCQEQAIAGVVFQRIEGLRSGKILCEQSVLKKRLEIPREVLLPWFALSEQIKQRNMLMNQRCVELTEMLRKDGFDSCILKGQGNTVMYPNPYSRTPGDIDVWVIPTSKVEGQRSAIKYGVKERRKVVTEFVRQRFPETRIRYQHIDYPVFPDVDVEVHFIPTAKNNPLHNKRIQQWAEEHKEEQCANTVSLPDGIGQIAIPTTQFNVIYQLSHLMHHFFDEGIGLRQMMDYYYLLRSSTKLEIRKEELEMTLKYLGLWKFAGAVMYVMREVFGMEEQYMIAPVDERRGRTLLNEILKGGNFGKYSGLTQHSTGGKYFLKHWRNLHFVKEYPSEALCEPIFRTWHFFWRWRHR